MTQSHAKPFLPWLLAAVAATPLLTADEALIEELPPYTLTGSRLPTLSVEEILPVVKFESETLEAMGHSRVETFLRSLPWAGVSATTSNPLNLNGGQNGISLRGLGNGNTLILVNGRRTAPYPQADASRLSFSTSGWPSAAIDRIELLPEGASTTYGSDAVAGVINIVLKKDFTGTEVNLGYEDFFDSDYRYRSVAVTTGVSRERWSLLLSADYSANEAVLFSERPVSRSEDMRSIGGQNFMMAFGMPGQLILPANTPGVPDTWTGRWIGLGTPGANGVTPGQPTTQPTLNDFVALPSPFTNGIPTPGGTTNNFDRAPWTSVIPEQEGWGVRAALEWKLSPSLNAFSELSWRQLITTSSLHPTPSSPTIEGPRGAIVFPASSPYNPFAVDIVDLRFQPTELGPRIREFIEQVPTWVGGLRGSGNGSTDWELSLLHTRRSVEEQAHNFYTDTGLADGLEGRVGGFINPFGPSDPGVFDSLRRTMHIDQEYDVTAINAWINGTAWELKGGPLHWGAGFEHRDESYVREPDAIAAVGGYAAWSTILPVDLGRSLTAGFVELSAPVVDSLTLYGALRAEDYNDFGLSVKPKISFVWSATEHVRLRVSRGKSFKAPELLDLQASQSEFSTTISDPQRPDDGPYTIRQVTGGNPSLDPEETESWRAELMWDIGAERAWNLSAAWWRYETESMVGSIGVNELVRLNDTTRVTREPPGADGRPGVITRVNVTLGNFDEVVTEGMDLSLTGRMNLRSAGALETRILLTHLIDHTLYPRSRPPLPLAGVTGYPRLRGSALLQWALDRWSTHLSFEWIREQKTLRTNWDGRSTDLDDFLQTHLSVSYQWSAALRLRIGIRNLFDEDPPLHLLHSRGYNVGFFENRGRSAVLSAIYTF